jgi:ABC-2 type transport system permease protein
MIVITAFDSEELGKLFGGLVLASIALWHLPSPSAMQWLTFVVLMAFSQLVLFGCALIMSGTVFKWVGNGRVLEMFDAVADFGNYPLSIFSKSAQSVISVVLPIAMIAHFPAAMLLGAETPLLLPSLIATLIFVFLSFAFWRWMLTQYTSAGG